MASQFRIFLTFLLIFISMTVQAFAQETPERYTSIRIIPETNKVQSGQTIMMAVELTMADHCHVYWANPGDSGLPVDVRWSGVEGIDIKDIKWPIPDKIPMDFLANYGYHDRVTLLQPITFNDVNPDEKITLKASLSILVCKEICIPESEEIEVVLNDPSAPAHDNSEIIAQAEKHLPQDASEWNYSFQEKDGYLLMRFTLEEGLLGELANKDLEFFPLDWGIINHAANPQIFVEDDAIWVVHPRGDQSLDDKEKLPGLLAIKGQYNTEKAYETVLYKNNDMASNFVISTEGSAESGQNMAHHGRGIKPSAPSQTDQITFFSAVIFALLGGLVLNLMPCVFPVLSMKALSLVKISEKEASLARKHGLAYTAGILASFLVIAGALLMFKSAGLLVGWGFQLQNPLIVGALAYLLFLIGLNLMGYFDVSNRFGGIGQSLSQKAGVTGTFFTGVLAAIVATPCTAPFMAAAIGFALVQPAFVSLTVFMALGLGLALPYVFLCFVPAACKLLPRPGAWMDGFKQFLAFPMFASAIWLVWVLSAQKGSAGVLYILTGMLFIVFCIWIKKVPMRPILCPFRNLIFWFMVFMPFVCLLYVDKAPMESADMQTKYEFGEKWSKVALDEALLSDEPVFVEMTASWCITCKINHAVAINIETTKNLFSTKKIRYFIGDWTNYDGEITTYLESFGRNGVPIYVYYPAPDPQSGERSEPVLLPQILTPSLLQEALGSK